MQEQNKFLCTSFFLLQKNQKSVILALNERWGNNKMEENKRRIYMPIGSARLLNIRVFLDDEVVYEGMVENAPQEIKNLKYSEIEIKDKFIYKVYSDMQ